MVFTRRQLGQQVALTPADRAEIRRCRRPHNQLGFGYQLGFVRLLNRFPKQEPLEIIDELVTFTAVQLGISPEEIEQYQVRRQTIAEHQPRILAHLGRVSFGKEQEAQLSAFVYSEAHRIEEPTTLRKRAVEHLDESGILRPAASRITKIVGEQRTIARKSIFERVAAGTPAALGQKLDALLIVPPGNSVSPLQALKANPSSPSIDGMLRMLAKMETIESTGSLDVDLSWMNGNFQRALFHKVVQWSAHDLRETSRATRHVALICFLWQSYQDAVDQTIDMFDKLMTRLTTKARNSLNEEMCQQQEQLRATMRKLRVAVQMLLDRAHDDLDVPELRERAFAQVPEEELVRCLNDSSDWTAGRRSSPFHGVVRQYSAMRRYAPAMLERLNFLGEPEGVETPCLRAIAQLRELNRSGKRKLPADAEAAFIPPRVRSIVGSQEAMSRPAWECALMLKLKDEIRSGNIAVRHSKRFGRLDDFFIEPSRWESKRSTFFARAQLPLSPEDVPAYLQGRLGAAFDRFLAAAPTNTYASVNEKGWKLASDRTEKLSTEDAAELARLKSWLSANMRRIRLPDLLIEVDNDLGFTRSFMPQSQRQDPSSDRVCNVLAAVMANGCNIGSHTMAQLTPGVTYEQLKRIGDWQLTVDSQREALAVLVNAISDLDTSLYWGEGKTSASDGQRFALPHKVLQQTYSPKFSDYALEFYSFVADNYAPFYSAPIQCSERDAAFVLDGLLYNESELEIEEHYTDTHGYTEINFAAFAMLGRRFSPRIRGVHRQRMCRIEKERDYGALASLVTGKDQTVKLEHIAEQWDQMGRFYASLESGHTTASVALRRLAGYSSRNRFYKANRDLGRIFKTEFILDYMSKPELRARIRRGLLKVEQMHALARDVFYGRRGRINARELWGQMNSCSCLTLIVACIIYWQAREISRTIRRCDPSAEGLKLAMLRHVSPIEWDNVVLYGQYVLNRRLVRSRGAKTATS